MLHAKCEDDGDVVMSDQAALGKAGITTRPDGLYETDRSGEWAAVVGVFDANNEIGDLVAWFLEKPGQWWRRTGDIPILGARDLAIAAYGGGAINLHPTPEAWLLARGDGVCVGRELSD